MSQHSFLSPTKESVPSLPPTNDGVDQMSEHLLLLSPNESVTSLPPTNDGVAQMSEHSLISTSKETVPMKAIQTSESNKKEINSPESMNPKIDDKETL